MPTSPQFPVAPVNQVPQTDIPVPTTSTEAQYSNQTYLREAQYINMWIGGKARTVLVPWLSQVRVKETYNDFQLVPTGGTFVLQPKAGWRVFTITVTRYQGTMQSFKALARAAYGLPQPADVRYDKMPLDILFSYELADSSGNYSANGQGLISEQWMYNKAYVNDADNGIMTSATSASDETITILASSEVYLGVPDIVLKTNPQPTSGWPK